MPQYISELSVEALTQSLNASQIPNGRVTPGIAIKTVSSQSGEAHFQVQRTWRGRWGQTFSTINADVKLTADGKGKTLVSWSQFPATATLLSAGILIALMLLFAALDVQNRGVNLGALLIVVLIFAPLWAWDWHRVDQVIRRLDSMH